MLVSVITVNYNDKNGLTKTINSVINQAYNNIEYVIIDGGSTDGSIDVINENKQHIDYWVSEPDAGIYDAMNKAILNVKGDYLIFLNSGDYFYNADSIKAFADNYGDFDIVYGNTECINDEKTWIQTYPSELTFSFFAGNTISHQSTFIKRSVFDKIGVYHTDMKFAADWALFMEAICLNNVTYKYLPSTISSYNFYGISSFTENYDKIAQEKKAYLEHNFPAFIADYRELMSLRKKELNFKNSRVRKYLAKIFKQLQI